MCDLKAPQLDKAPWPNTAKDMGLDIKDGAGKTGV